MAKKTKKQFIPYDKEWSKEANKIARAYSPRIYPCKNCGAPVLAGYCCNYCDSVNP